MPSSSALSHSSGASRRAKGPQYRTVCPNSQVDESLFGEPHRVAHRRDRHPQSSDAEPEVMIEQQAAQRQARRLRQSAGSPPRERIQVITKDLIRDLIVPHEDPSGNSLVLPFAEYMRIKAKSRFQTDEEREQGHQATKLRQEQEMDEVMQRKNKFKQLDVSRKKSEKLTDLEEEAKEKAQHLLQKAMMQRQEQEDEIKRLNELILNAKCHAIRDAQILEREEMTRELQDEEVRLDDMMEVDRRNAIRIQEEIEKKRRENEMIGASRIVEQIHENEQEKLLDLERKDQENVAMAKYLERLMEEEKVKLERKRAEQDRLREELNKANDNIMQRREVAKLQDKALEAKVLQFQKEKAEREAAFEAEQERIKAEKEKEVARLRAMQERARDEQAERDGLRAKRAAEAAEREWRRKEAEEAVKRKVVESDLSEARAAQLTQKQHFLAAQAARERAEFERVLKAQKELIEKDKREEVEHGHRRSRYNEEIRKQIQHKEREKIQERNAFFEEAVKTEEEARLRRMRLEEAKNRKLTELRAAGIPEKYLAQVERKAHQPQHISA